MEQTQSAKVINWEVEGMSCTNCALGIEKYLEKAGMEQVMVNFSTGEVQFAAKEDLPLSPIAKGISQLGFTVHQNEPTLPREGWSALEKRFVFCLIFTLPLLAHMFVSFHFLHNPWVQLGLATPVFLVGMYHFGRSAWRSLRVGVPNMDVLITLGALAAFGYSLYGTLWGLGPNFLFYETAASIITLVLLGNVLEHRAVKRTTSAIDALVRLRPQRAKRLLNPDHEHPEWEEVSLDKIRVGDWVQVHTGDRIPLDGEIQQGNGDLDESMLTGESLPVFRQSGETVLGGTVLIDGQLQIRVTKTGGDTVLSQIIALVKQAQNDKPQLQQLADRISAIFVPVVLAIAFLTFMLAYGLFDLGMEAAWVQAVAVLVIACPCAMGLATPTAVMVGLGRASRQGILIKGARTLEQIAQVKRVVFDKTGTLTTGAFRIADLQVLEGDQASIESIILGLESHTNHPIGRSLLKAFAGRRPKSMQSVREVKGLGMIGQDESGATYQLGSFRIAQGLTDDLSHALYLVRDGVLIATLDLEDELRPGAQACIAYLKEQGIETILLSGDRQEACARVGEALGLDQVYAEQMPEEKQRRLKAWNESSPTAMVGDGINDAPALAQASVGISLGKATDVAIHAAQVLLMREDLQSLIALHQIGRHTLITIKQNLFWAFFYNVLAIPLAAVGMLRPILAAAAMAASDIVVIGNSLRLKLKSLT